MSLVYLASPYSKYPYGREEAFQEACRKAAELMMSGYKVFCPIAHSHPIEQYGIGFTLPGDWWLKQDFAVLRACSKLFVYKMPGWEDSYGVGKEIEFAKNNNIEIDYLEYDEEQFTEAAATN